MLVSVEVVVAGEEVGAQQPPRRLTGERKYPVRSRTLLVTCNFGINWRERSLKICILNQIYLLVYWFPDCYCYISVLPALHLGNTAELV